MFDQCRSRWKKKEIDYLHTQTHTHTKQYSAFVVVKSKLKKKNKKKKELCTNDNWKCENKRLCAKYETNRVHESRNIIRTLQLFIEIASFRFSAQIVALKSKSRDEALNNMQQTANANNSKATKTNDLHAVSVALGWVRKSHQSHSTEQLNVSCAHSLLVHPHLNRIDFIMLKINGLLSPTERSLFVKWNTLWGDKFDVLLIHANR